MQIIINFLLQHRINIRQPLNLSIAPALCDRFHHLLQNRIHHCFDAAFVQRINIVMNNGFNCTGSDQMVHIHLELAQLIINSGTIRKTPGN